VHLETFGWSPYFSEQFEPFAREGLIPGRVALESRGTCRVWTADGEIVAETSGGLRHAARERGELPAVGDWVAVKPVPGETAKIRAVLARRGAFSRKVAGSRAERQVVAANVDTVFLVAGLDGDFNLRRLERYLTLAWEGGARPVVVLSKADVCDDVAARVAEAEGVAAGVPVLAVSSALEGGLAPLEAYLEPGHTLALLGSSGVGKSTIVNRLLGAETQRTSAVREHDSRGRHTTTHRELFLLPSGALLVDTPGMRELHVWGDGGGLEGAFSDVEALARSCRFSDCRHQNEPGCAVAEALANGSLDEARFANYVALERELAHTARRHDQRLQLAEKQRWKAIHKAQRQYKKK
jgi:ribosome biogenesis GTPase